MSTDLAPPPRAQTSTSRRRLDALRRRDDFVPLLALAAAVLLGLAIRLYYVLPADFPVNDGGLFYAMARDIQDAHYALPAHTSYNAESMPFAYPPLFLYLLALLDDATPLSMFDILRFLPLVASVASIPAFYLLARKLVPSTVGVAAAVLVFATIQNGFEWHIMGGGITRAPALLFSLLSIYYAYRTYEGYRPPHIAAAAGFAGLALLTHPDLFVIVSVALLFLIYGRSRRGLIATAFIAVAVAAVTAPWWGTVIARHGIDTLLATGGSRTQQGWTDSVLPWRDFLTFPFTKQPLLNWPAVFAVIGGCASVVAGQLFLPAWLVLEVLAEPHQAPNFVHVPLALLIGWAAGAVVTPAFSRLSADRHRVKDAPERQPRSEVRRNRRLDSMWVGSLLLGGYLLVVAMFSAFNEPGQLDHMKALTEDERALMAAGDTNIPAGSPVLVVSGLPWWGDRVSEWFPALTRSHSLFTAQGSEWLGDAFTERIAGHDDLQQCGSASADCLDRVAREHDVAFRFVYIDAKRCGPLLESVRGSSDYHIVTENTAGAVAERLAPSGG